MSKKVVIAGACRTAIGKMGGALSTTPAPVLGSIVIKEALNRAGVPVDQVDHVYMGCVIQAGLGQNVARQAALKAGLPIETPAVTVNVVCGSGLNCVNMAAQMIQAGDADIVVAGGMENMSMAPYALPQARFGYRMNNGTVVDTMVNDALTDAFNNYHMMITAENVAEQWGLTREELDAFSANSQQKCEKAMAEGKFKDEIVPVEVKTRKQTIIVDTDEGPRAGTTVETLSKLRCCSGKPDGVVTAGNASGINDGAAAVVVMSEEKAKELERQGKYGFRVKDISWWKEELPTEEEMKHGMDVLKRNNNIVDYIISHSPSTSELYLIGGVGLYETDVLTNYLEEIKATTNYKKHFFGHMHVDQAINSESICLYEQIIRII